MEREIPKRTLVIFFIIALMALFFGRGDAQEAEFLTKIYVQGDTVYFKIIHQHGEIILHKFPLIVPEVKPPDSVIVQEDTLDTLTVSWNPNTEPDLAGYKVHYGIEPGVYESIDVGYLVEYDIEGLTGPHYFAVTAYDTAGNESLYSDEIRFPPAETLLSYDAGPRELDTWKKKGVVLIRPTQMHPVQLDFCGYAQSEDASIKKEFDNLVPGHYKMTFDIYGGTGKGPPDDQPYLWIKINGAETQWKISKGTFQEFMKGFDWPGGICEVEIISKVGQDFYLKRFRLEKIN